MPDYSTRPSNIMPGLQMFGQGLQQYGRGMQRKADFERERVKGEKTQKLRERAVNVFQTGDPKTIAEFVVNNPGAKDIYTEMLGAKHQTMVDEAKRWLIDNEGPVEMHTKIADEKLAAGEDITDEVDDIRSLMVDQEGEREKREKILAIYDPKAFKAYQKQQGNGDIDSAFKKQKTGAYLVKNAEGDTQIIAGVFDPKTGKMTVEGGELPEGFEPVSKLGETGAEETERKVGEKEKKTRVVKTEQRYSNLVDRGITSAESTATIRRGIELLDSVKTGGFNAASLRAKQIFGIESADEGELSNSLGKAVLSQLRETFGAAFTENEGNRLARIEAAFGKSPEANKRLLKQSLSLAERTARRAMDAAYKRGDMNTVNDINELLTFTLTGDEEKEEAQKPANGKQVLKFDAQGNLVQ